MQSLSLSERFSYGAIGAVFGAGYGALLGWLLVWMEGGAWSSAYVKSSSVVFAVLSFVAGSFVGEVIAAFIMVFVGLLQAILAFETLTMPGQGESIAGMLKAIVWFSIATAIAIYLGGKFAKA